MTEFINTLNQAIDSQQKSPPSKETLEALVEAEKESRKQKPQYRFEQFLGTWQLWFINGTNQSRSQLANLLTDGFYLPTFIPVQIAYTLPTEKNNNENQGRVVNTVSVGLVKFTIEGPCKFLPSKNILAFDFTYLTMYILGAKVYSQNIRGGKKSDSEFFAQSIKNQAFFSYFLVSDKLIAARGRGGGLALWKKIN